MAGEFKDILETASTFGPRFFDDFVGLVAGPKRFLGRINLAAKQALNGALAFTIIGLAINMALEWPLHPAAHAFWEALAGLILINVIVSAVGSAAIKLSFHLVGGRAPFRSFFILSLYVNVPFLVLAGLLVLTSHEVVVQLDPASLPLFLKLSDPTALLIRHDLGDILAAHAPIRFTPALTAALAMIGLIYAFACWWSYICWGAYRELARVSKTRSGLAAAIVGCILQPLGWLVFVAQTGLGLSLL